jgi:DNA-binding NtrC family response regulator
MALEAAEQPHERGSAEGLKARVLLIDEAPDDLVYNSVLLQSLGCEVFACWSYADGEQEVGKGSWDMVVVSQGSGAFEGHRVLEHATNIGRKIPILVLAPSHDMHCYLEAMQLGAVDYLEEPVSASEMRRVLDTHLPVRLSRASSRPP